MRRVFVMLWAFMELYAFAAHADLPAYTLVRQKSFIKFFAIQNNAPVKGKFEDFSADIRFDPERLDQSSIRVEVKISSITAANDEVVSTVKLPEWLSAQAFPTAVFRSRKIWRMPSTDNYYGDGELTLRGKTVPVTLNFMIERMDEEGAIAGGYVTLRRGDFGVGQGQWAKDDVVKNEVRVEFRVVAEKIH